MLQSRFVYAFLTFINSIKSVETIFKTAIAFSYSIGDIYSLELWSNVVSSGSKSQQLDVSKLARTCSNSRFLSFYFPKGLIKLITDFN